MGCSVHCSETGSCCKNGDVHIVCLWTNALLALLDENPGLGMEEAIKQCSKTHYDAIHMDEIQKPFVGRPEAFYQFLQDTWKWIVTIDPDGKRILADENKTECVCPLVRAGAAVSQNLCNCSEGFAELMFSKVLEKPVKARVVESVLRGGNHCIYEITTD